MKIFEVKLPPCQTCENSDEIIAGRCYKCKLLPEQCQYNKRNEVTSCVSCGETSARATEEGGMCQECFDGLPDEIDCNGLADYDPE